MAGQLWPQLFDQVAITEISQKLRKSVILAIFENCQNLRNFLLHLIGLQIVAALNSLLTLDNNWYGQNFDWNFELFSIH